MITREFLQKIRRIQITTSRLVSNTFAGRYHSVFKGRGMEFDEVREYVPGDEIRSIDWNVTARTGQPYVKKFVEERELTVVLVLDASPSCFFSTVNQFKSQLAAELCSVLAFSAIKNNDKVGIIVFSDGVKKYLAPRKGSRHVLRVIREALYRTSSIRAQFSGGTYLAQALEYLGRVVKRRAIVFLLSDFVAPDFKKELALANKRHDLIAVTITDPKEVFLPDAGLAHFFDPETQKTILVDTSDDSIRARFAEHAAKRIQDRYTLFRSLGIDFIDIRTDVPYHFALVKFFKERERRRQIRAA